MRFFLIFSDTFLFGHYILHKGIRKATSKGHEADIHYSLLCLTMCNVSGMETGFGFCCHLGNPGFPKSSNSGCVLFLVFLCHVVAKCKVSQAFSQVC